MVATVPESRIAINFKFKGMNRKFIIKKKQKLKKALSAFREKIGEQHRSVLFFHNTTPLTGEDTAETANLNEDDCIIMKVMKG